MRQTSYSIKRSLGIALIAAFTLNVASISDAQERLLLERATKVTGTMRWDMLHNYSWVSNTKVLFVGKDMRWHSYDVVRKKERAFPAQEKFLQNPTERIASFFTLCLSLDSRWALWTDKSRTWITCAAFDGSRLYRRKLRRVEALQWMGDSQHWVAWTVGTEHGLTAHIYRWDGKQHWSATLTVLPQHAFPRMFALDRILSDTFVTYYDIEQEVSKAGHLRLHQWDLQAHPLRQKSFQVTYPAGAEIYDREYSAGGDQVLWKFMMPVAPTVRTGQAALLRTKEQRIGLWASQLNGSGMHEIGSLPEANVFGLQGLRWLPDGRHVSFLYKQGLYVVSTD